MPLLLSGQVTDNAVQTIQGKDNCDSNTEQKEPVSNGRGGIKQHKICVDGTDGVDDLYILIFLYPGSYVAEENNKEKDIFLRNQVLAKQQEKEYADDCCNDAVFDALVRFPDVDLRQRKDDDADPHRLF